MQRICPETDRSPQFVTGYSKPPAAVFSPQQGVPIIWPGTAPAPDYSLWSNPSVRSSRTRAGADSTGAAYTCPNPPAHPQSPGCLSSELSAQWDKVIALRTDVNKALEAARGQKLVGKSLDAEVTLYLTAEGKEAFDAMGQHDLAAVCIVSKVTVVEGEGQGVAGENFPGVTIAVAPSQAPKCSRCWAHNDQVDAETELCPRCAGVLKKIQIG